MESDYTFAKMKLISITISVLLLFQSCNSYYAIAISLEEAANHGKVATIIYNKDEKSAMDFDKIIKLDSANYGINWIRGGESKQPFS